MIKRHEVEVHSIGRENYMGGHVCIVLRKRNETYSATVADFLEAEDDGTLKEFETYLKNEKFKSFEDANLKMKDLYKKFERENKGRIELQKEVEWLKLKYNQAFGGVYRNKERLHYVEFELRVCKGALKRLALKKELSIFQKIHRKAKGIYPYDCTLSEYIEINKYRKRELF